MAIIGCIGSNKTNGIRHIVTFTRFMLSIVTTNTYVEEDEYVRSEQSILENASSTISSTANVKVRVPDVAIVYPSMFCLILK